jgi:hypothetical protein
VAPVRRGVQRVEHPLDDQRRRCDAAEFLSPRNREGRGESVHDRLDAWIHRSKPRPVHLRPDLGPSGGRLKDRWQVIVNETVDRSHSRRHSPPAAPGSTVRPEHEHRRNP